MVNRFSSASLSDRPTSDRLLWCLLEDEERKNRRTQSTLARVLSVTTGSIGDHLRELSERTPALVVKRRYGHWQLTPEGQAYVKTFADSSLPHVVTQGVPFFGFIGAGEVVEVSFETVITYCTISVDPQRHFVMKVRGEGMQYRHICKDDWVVFRIANSWDDIEPTNIIAASVPKGANVTSFTWLKTIVDGFEPKKETGLIRYTTLKEIDPRDGKLIRGLRKSLTVPVMPIGVLVQVIRQI